MIDKDSLKIKELEHVLIEKVEQLFRDMLYATGEHSGGAPGAAAQDRPDRPGHAVAQLSGLAEGRATGLFDGARSGGGRGGPPGRQREGLVRDRIAIENRIETILCLHVCLHGIAGFKPRPLRGFLFPLRAKTACRRGSPRLRKAAERLQQLRSFTGTPLPQKTKQELEGLMRRHHLLSEQMKDIEAKRDAVATIPYPDREERMIRILADIVGLGMETATLLVHVPKKLLDFFDI